MLSMRTLPFSLEEHFLGLIFAGISLRVIKKNISAPLKSSKMSRPAGKAQVHTSRVIPDHEGTLESSGEI